MRRGRNRRKSAAIIWNYSDRERQYSTVATLLPWCTVCTLGAEFIFQVQIVHFRCSVCTSGAEFVLQVQSLYFRCQGFGETDPSILRIEV